MSVQRIYDDYTDNAGGKWVFFDGEVRIECPAVDKRYGVVPAGLAYIHNNPYLGLCIEVCTATGARYRLTIKDNDTVVLNCDQGVSIRPTGSIQFELREDRR